MSNWMKRASLGGRAALLWACAVLAAPTLAASVQTVSPQGEVARIRQARITFSEAMVPFGEPRQPAPMSINCQGNPTASGTGRWVDDKTWVHDFAQDLPAGTRCSLQLRPGVKALSGEAVTGEPSYDFSTGGPSIVRAYPSDNGYSTIEEDQVFALLLNGQTTGASVERHAHCEFSEVAERVPLKVVSGTPRTDIIKALGLVAQQARVLTVRCARPLPPQSKVTLVWGEGIATPSGVPNSKAKRLSYEVRPPFLATFSCERSSARADCLPIKPMRIEFSSPVPRKLAEGLVLKTPDGSTHSPQVELDEGVVNQVIFKAPFPEQAALQIELPKGFKDDAGRPLSNAAAFPVQTRTAAAPPLVKFPRATFGVLELHAEPMLPVTVRSVEPALAAKGLQPARLKPGAVRELKISTDAQIMAWLAKVKRYDESRLPRQAVERELGIKLPKPVKPAHTDANEQPDEDVVQTRTVSLLNGHKAAQRLSLPSAASTGPRPFEVIGIPLPEPGFHVVEIESPRLGQVLLDKAAPMYVRTSVLVTNLGVHFKWGAVNAGVWVTTLDKARPVPGAQVQISDCRGRSVWKGQTNAQGFALVKEALPALGWRYCSEGDDGEPGGAQQEQGYFVSARKTDAQGRADMAFVWSTWNEGIEAWRFHLSTGNTEEPAKTIYHSVMDRTLLRAGQSVSMLHHARTEALRGLQLVRADALPTQARIVHEGSEQEFKFPLQWRGQRHAETVFKIPEDAKLGTYRVSLDTAQGAIQTGSFRVEEFRLPVMTGRISGPKTAVLGSAAVPLGVQINYGNGGGAAGLPVRVSAQLAELDIHGALRTERYPGFTFEAPREPRQARGFFADEPMDDSEGEGDYEGGASQAKLVADKLPLKLDAQGAATLSLPPLPEIKAAKQLLVQATYADPNGEVQTLSQTLPVWPAGVVLGLRTDSWVSIKQKVATQVLALDTNGKPQAGVNVQVRAVAHRTSSTRKRLVGGFYAYDNQSVADELGEVCSGTSDARGLVLCEVALGTEGEIELIAQAKDSGGRVSRSAASVWVTRQGELWFGGDNQDRMDVIPEQRQYEAGQVARFQVRSPFRQATALVAIERNGILETMVVSLLGKDPTIEVPIKAEWAPNVYVSVLAVRGRVLEVPWYSFFTWGWRSPGEWWRAYRGDSAQYQEPTAMVDLSKPAFKYGIAEIKVGTAAHALSVEVTPDRASYPVRGISQVRIKVKLPDGSAPPAGTEVALAAVDEALLELKPNDSWDLLGAMIRPRDYGMETATAQMQIIGKRHFGKKAVPAGGGGGAFPTRELFDTLLLWNPRVVLDAQGQALVKVPLNDSLTSFRIVVVGDVVKAGDVALFGTGRASIRATQDLQIISGVPPLVREGDRYRAMLTLRNTTSQPMTVVLKAQAGSALPEQRLSIAANAAIEAGWDVQVPLNTTQIAWAVSAQAQGVQDRLAFTQAVRPAVPVTVQQATLMPLDKALSIAIAPPRQALAGADGALRGGIEVALKPRLADGLPGVSGYFNRYPWSCLEQKASIAIGLRDVAQWQRLASQIPLYLDEDGLANYFPPGPGSSRTGSDSLTAYLLSITAEATGLGYDFNIPPEARDKMERGLIAFVEGRLQREFWAPASLKGSDLDVRKVAALEALSRTGRAQARMLGSIQILPNQWPTSAVIDWLLVLDRVKDIPDRDKRLAEADQILRARLNVQGTRLGFSTEQGDDWWWLMSNADVNSVRMLLGVLSKPSWQADVPRLATGSLQRHQSGHWSTTVANAWGSVAMEAFSKRFEREPVTGQTKAGFEGSTAPAAQTLNWARQPTGATLALGWPAGFGVGGQPAPTSVKLTHEGTGKPWVTLTSKAAVPLLAPFGSGYRITKTVTPVEQKIKGRYSRGDVLRVRLDVDAQLDATWVVLNDPVPGGASILGSGLGRDSAIDTRSEQGEGQGWLAYQERSLEAFRAYYRFVPKGRFSVEYTLRLNNPGSFGLPQTRVEAMYAPELFGEAPNPAVVVGP